MPTYHVEILNRRGAPGAIPWQEWTASSLAEARGARKPVLLFLTVNWSTGCAVMERRVFAEPTVARLVKSDWIPIRVDADRRPDIDARYNLGGWPTTALLTPEGAVLFGGTFFEADELAKALVDSLAFFKTAAVALEAAQPGPVAVVDSRSAPRPIIDFGAVDWIVEDILRAADPVHGGFGTGPKGLCVDALALLVDRYRRHADTAAGDVVLRSLDAICAHLYDSRGGFCRGAQFRDWGGVRREKRMADNAALVPLLIDAAALFDRPLFRDRAVETVDWCRSSMMDAEHGGFFGSVRQTGTAMGEEQDDGGDSIDRTLFADVNAAMSATGLKVGEAFGDQSLIELALTSLERVVLALYRPGNGVAHYASHAGRSMGFLQDQVRMAAALVTAARLTGRVPYVMLAEELMQFTRRTLWDEDAGGFFDRNPPVADEGDVGLLGERVKPFDLNCEAARTLAALAEISERDEYLGWADQALASQTPVHRDYGVDGAAYALAALDLLPAAPGS